MDHLAKVDVVNYYFKLFVVDKVCGKLLNIVLVIDLFILALFCGFLCVVDHGL